MILKRKMEGEEEDWRMKVEEFEEVIEGPWIEEADRYLYQLHTKS